MLLLLIQSYFLKPYSQIYIAHNILADELQEICSSTFYHYTTLGTSQLADFYFVSISLLKINNLLEGVYHHHTT